MRGDGQGVDADQEAGQCVGPRLRALVVQADGSREPGHQQGRVVAVLGGRVHRDECGRRDVRRGEQAQDVRLARQQALGVPHEEGRDEGAQDQGAGAVRAGDVQAAHLRRPAAAQPLHPLDALPGGQGLLHPGAGGGPGVCGRVFGCGPHAGQHTDARWRVLDAVPSGR